MDAARLPSLEHVYVTAGYGAQASAGGSHELIAVCVDAMQVV